jgi:hypothetical protein
MALSASTILVVAVAVLLGLVVAAARSVERHAAAILETGEHIARNTAPILMLEQAHETVRQLRAGVEDLHREARSLRATIAARRHPES